MVSILALLGNKEPGGDADVGLLAINRPVNNLFVPKQVQKKIFTI